MSIHYLFAIKQQLYNFVANSNAIKYPFILSSTTIYTTKQSFLDLIKSQNPNNAALIAFKLLPVYNIFPNVIIHELLSMLTPQDRIELSHSCKYFRSLIISPRCLSDLWLYIYHIPTQKITKNTSQSNVTRSTFLSANMIFNTTNNNDTLDPSPSHATSIPNTLASTAINSCQLSIFKTSATTSTSSSLSRSESLPTTPLLKIKHSHNVNKKIDENNIISLYENDDNETKESDCGLSSSTSEITFEKQEDTSTDSHTSSTGTLLSHPENPVLTSKIIYWPNYKQVLSCDFPRHWKRKNSFYKNLCILSKHCGGAHIRVFEIGIDRLNQILSRISPMLLSLCFLNIHKINFDLIQANVFKQMKRLSYLAYQYIDVDAGSTLHIAANITALEFTSCSFNSASCFMLTGSNIKFLQICNCRFTNYSFQQLLSLCPNIIHISITTSSWNGTISLPSNLLSIIWKNNDGDLTISQCNKIWEVATTIYDHLMIEKLQKMSSLKQLVVATPLFKEIDECLDQIESNKPWLFQSTVTTPYYNAQSPSFTSISHISLSPNAPNISPRFNSLTLSPSSSLKKEKSISTLSLDSDDEQNDIDDMEQKEYDTDTLRIVISGELMNKDLLKNQFVGDHIKFVDQRIINPTIQTEFEKLNPIFVREMTHTTHMFLISFPFF